MRGVLLLCLISFSYVLEAAIPPQECPESHHFGNWERDYTITLPERWQIKRNFLGLDVYAAAPPKSELMGSRANISVVTAPLPEDGSVDTFYEASRKDLERVLLDFKVIETGQAAFFGFGGKKIEYYHSAHTRDKIRTIQYYLVHRNHALVITYSADLDEYPKYLDIFEKSAKTLKFH